MCGIAGIISFSYEESGNLDAIGKLAGALRHRGPDDDGFFSSGHVALGMRRLSIIDLVGGKQPIATPDGRYTIVYNGEIFNYRELRADLVARGVSFQTHSDTEVVLHGFAADGPAFLDRCDGMFAFLIFDAKAGTLHAGRDPFGIKPLYGYQEGNCLLIASEIKAIRAAAERSFQVDPDALRSYLTCGYVPGPGTLVRGLFRFAPGTVTSIDRNGGRKEESFGRRMMPGSLASGGKGNDLRSTLISAVDRALVADVPVGLYLSGGIDSSLIASIVSRELGQKLQTFSVGFPADPAHDERAFAEQVAGKLGLSHESIAAEPEDFLDLQPLARTLEEPMADPSALLLGNLSRLASSKVKVVLSGEGGDELFGGYHRYYWDGIVKRYLGLPRVAQILVRGLASLCPSDGMRRRLQKLRETEGLDRPVRYVRWFSSFRGDEQEALLTTPGVGANLERFFEGIFSEAKMLSNCAQLQWVDLVTFLRDDLLPKADKMSMVNSLEVRVPFLQASVVEAAFSLTERERVAGQTKPALRDILRKYLPAEIVDRKKRGFEVPMGRWMRGPLRPLLDRYVSEEAVRARGLLRWDTVSKIKSEHEQGRSDRGLALYSLCLLEAWCREFV